MQKGRNDLSSVVAPYVLIATTYGNTNDDNVVKLAIFCFARLCTALYKLAFMNDLLGNT